MMLKIYQRHVKKIKFVIGLNMMDNQLVHIKSYKGSAEPCKTICNIQETKSLSYILFICCNFFQVQDARGQWLIGPLQQGQGVRGSTWLFESTCKRQRHCHDFAREYAVVVQIFDYHYRDDMNNWTYDKLCDNTFDARDVEVQGQGASRWGCHHGVVTK